jgi:hypothetical protein
MARLNVAVIREFVATPVPVGLTDSTVGAAATVVNVQLAGDPRAAPAVSVTAPATVTV